ncbi:MAG: hypothetical protein K2Q14_04310, partial [Gammaproteobacteria bacterium]|nr:hypothetical protein [Gammaproteobacteria bacterium]
MTNSRIANADIKKIKPYVVKRLENRLNDIATFDFVNDLKERYQCFLNEDLQFNLSSDEKNLQISFVKSHRSGSLSDRRIQGINDCLSLVLQVLLSRLDLYPAGTTVFSL